jgi:hypothetical protein
MIAAVGLASRPTRSRSAITSAWFILFKGPVVAPGGEPAVSRAPRWQAVRQQPPRAARAQDINEDPPREVEMREMTGGCLCGQVQYSANTDPAIVAVCHCRTVRSRLALLSQCWLAFQKQRFQFKAILKRSTIPATAGNQLIETSVRNADRLLSQMLLLCPISGSSRLARSTTRAGWTLKCMCIVIVRSPGPPYPKAVKNSERCLRSFQWLLEYRSKCPSTAGLDEDGRAPARLKGSRRKHARTACSGLRVLYEAVDTRDLRKAKTLFALSGA